MTRFHCDGKQEDLWPGRILRRRSTGKFVVYLTTDNAEDAHFVAPIENTGNGVYSTPELGVFFRPATNAELEKLGVPVPNPGLTHSDPNEEEARRLFDEDQAHIWLPNSEDGFERFLALVMENKRMTREDAMCYIAASLAMTMNAIKREEV